MRRATAGGAGKLRLLLPVLLWLLLAAGGREQPGAGGGVPGGGAQPAAAQPPGGEQAVPQQPPPPLFGLELASRVRGYSLTNWQDERLASADDLVVDLTLGTTLYAVFSLQEGDRLVPIPVAYLIPDEEQGQFVADLTRGFLLKNPPSFSRLQLEEAGGLAGLEPSVFSFWNATRPNPPGLLQAKWQGVEQPFPGYGLGTGFRLIPVSLIRFSELQRLEVYGRGGEQIGRVEDLVMDPASGEVISVLLARRGEPSPARELFPMPLSAFTYHLPLHRLLLDVGAGPFAGAPAVAPAVLATQIRQPDWQRRYHGYWETLDPELAFRRGAEVFAGEYAKASSFRGIEVDNWLDTRLGSIVDAILTPDGSVPYLLLAPEGPVTPSRRRWVPVPLEAFSFHLRDRTLTLGLSSTQLGQAPGYPRGRLPDTQDPAWESDLLAYWERLLAPAGAATGSPAAHRTRGAEQAFLLSDYLGFGLRNLQGQTLARVEEVMLDLESGRARYTLFSVLAGSGPKGKLLAAPFGTGLLDVPGREVLVNLDAAALQEAPLFSANDLPDMSSPSWERRVQEFWRAP
jgi:sporulation protein YlmC with PRC-barrel domain